MRTCRSHFSLLEMIAVMTVIVILTAISIPAVTKMMAGNAVSSGTREVGGELHIARAAALAKRRYVAVLMPGGENNGLADTAKFTCYRLAYVTRATSSYTFDSYVEGSRWKYIPTGASIMEADGDKGINVDGTLGGYSKLPADNGASTVQAVDLSKLGGSGSANNVRAVIFSPAGKPMNTGLYVTVGEALYSGGNWTIKNPSPAGEVPTNESCKNQMTIELNAFTGSVQYKIPYKY